MGEKKKAISLEFCAKVLYAKLVLSLLNSVFGDNLEAVSLYFDKKYADSNSIPEALHFYSVSPGLRPRFSTGKESVADST